MAADSAGTIQGDGRSASTESVCKIYQVNSELFFAVSGLVSDAQSGFSIPRIVESDARGKGTINERLAKLEPEVTDAVLGELPQVKQRDQPGYQRLIGAKGVVTVMLAGIDGGIPVAAGFALGLGASADGGIEPRIVRDSCPGNCPSGVRAFYFGEGGEIDRLRASGGLPALGMPELARYMVHAEIDAHMPRVAAPIDVLRITPTGPVWVQRKQICPANIPTVGK
jgi:hypothetical protein